MVDPGDDGVLDTAGIRSGTLIGGKFVLLRRIGEGGVGVVFEAEDTWIGRRVAIKVLHTHLAGRREAITRFRREARAAAKIHHPNIVAVFEVGQRRDGSFFIVQEYIEGISLREHLATHGRPTVAAVLEIMVPIMGALAAAHRAGIVHRDIKPENILLARSPDGEVIPKLIDFGVAKTTLTSEHETLSGSVIGTPAYMSPEQAGGLGEADPRTDIWAIGALMFELLSGACPYTGPSAAVILERILTEPVPSLAARAADVPIELVKVVHRALERDPDDRFATMSAFLTAVLDFGKTPDPTLPGRHARSIPPPDLNWNNEPPVPVEESETPPPSQASPQEKRTVPEWARPMAQPELGWYEERPSPRAPKNLAWFAAAAGESLRINALDEAIDHAEHAISTCHAQGEMLGQMRLVQAIALRWLGHYADSERCAIEAATRLTPGSTGWYAALGHLAIVGGYIGKNERFPSMIAELARLEEQGTVSSSHVVTACRLSISLVRAGLADQATSVLASARAHAEPETIDEPVVRAWVDVAESELAVHSGDPTTYLVRLESAVLGFVEAGDARNACLQRANVGNAYMQLGAYARAKAVLREALTLGEPMKLNFIAPVRANLGLAVARLGDLDQALEIETAALDTCVREGYRRFELASRIYLAVIYVLRGELAHAITQVQAALEGAASAPPIRAHGLAILADIQMSQGQAEAALSSAAEAMGILEILEGVEEGEALIRVVHAQALEAVGHGKTARARIVEARKRLLDRAARITDPRLRRSFLDHIPENARTLAMATRLKRSAP